MNKLLNEMIKKVIKEGKNPLIELEEDALYNNYKDYGVSKERFLEIYSEEASNVYNKFQRVYPKSNKTLIKKLDVKSK